jgi:hypothetical protein
LKLTTQRLDRNADRRGGHGIRVAAGKLQKRSHLGHVPKGIRGQVQVVAGIAIPLALVHVHLTVTGHASVDHVVNDNVGPEGSSDASRTPTATATATSAMPTHASERHS